MLFLSMEIIYVTRVCVTIGKFNACTICNRLYLKNRIFNSITDTISSQNVYFYILYYALPTALSWLFMSGVVLNKFDERNYIFLCI